MVPYICKTVKCLLVRHRNRKVTSLSSNYDKERPVRGNGQQIGRPGLGPNGMCKCSSCKHTIPHQRGTPCTKNPCPKCGAIMYRE